MPEVVLTQAFDAAGNRTSLAAEIDTTDDFLSEYTYDDLGRMTRVQQSGQSGGNSVAPKRVDFAYDAAGRFDTITRYANLAGTQLVAQTGYTYDDASRLTALTHSKGQTTLAGYTWTYDTKGRLTEYDSTIDGTADYTYDDTDQLTGADYSYQTDETYTYDANGNRTNTGYDTDPNNRLASDGTYNYEYDDEGNRTKRTNISTGAVTEYTWDYRNRLTKVLERASAQGPATKVTEYSYDVFDRRVGKDVDDDGDQDVDHGERYVYDGQHVALQFDGDDNLTHRYLFGPAVDQVLADEDASGDVLWSLADHQGTVRDLAEYDSGQDETTVVNHVKYDAFGNITGQSNSSLTPHFAYTGREWDPDAGLYYYRARWYDPKTGRFLSEDPIGFAAGDTNLYRYCTNGPTIHVDPTGMKIYLAKGQRGRWDPVGVIHQDIAVDTWTWSVSGGGSGGRWVKTGYASYSFGLGASGGNLFPFPRQQHWLGFTGFPAALPLGIGFPPGNYMRGQIYDSTFDPKMIFATLTTTQEEDIRWRRYMDGRLRTPDRYSVLWWNCVNYTNLEFGRAKQMFGFV